MLTATGTVTKVEAKPWKNPDPRTGQTRETVYVHVTEHGYSERYELSSSLDKSLAERFIGTAISGAVRVFRSFDEKANRVNTRVVLMSLDNDAHSVAA